MSNLNLIAPPDNCDVGADVRVYATELIVGSDVSIGRGTVLVGDRVVLGDGVRIGPDVDARASNLEFGPNSEIGARSRILCSDIFQVGQAGRICTDVRITAREFRAGKLLYLGDGSSVGYGGTMASTSIVSIGNRVAFGPFTIINANQFVEIGDDTGTGSHVSIWTHGFHFGHRVLDGYSDVFKPVKLANGVWLSYHCTVLPGVSIGKETIVAAGAVVTKSAGDRLLLAGVPAVEKARLDPKPLDDVAALAWARTVMDEWCSEVRWKGLTADADGPLSWNVNHLGQSAKVILTANSREIPLSRERCIVVYVGSEKNISPLTPQMTLLQLRLGNLLGPTDKILEDLRDHLRRHTAPCGDEICFSSILPESFERLLSVES